MKHYTKETWAEFTDTSRLKPPTILNDFHAEIVRMMKNNDHPRDIRLRISDYNYQRVIARGYTEVERVYIRRVFCFIRRCDKTDAPADKNDFIFGYAVKNSTVVDRTKLNTSTPKFLSVVSISRIWRYITKSKHTKLD